MFKQTREQSFLLMYAQLVKGLGLTVYGVAGLITLIPFLPVFHNVSGVSTTARGVFGFVNLFSVYLIFWKIPAYYNAKLGKVNIKNGSVVLNILIVLYFLTLVASSFLPNGMSLVLLGIGLLYIAARRVYWDLAGPYLIAGIIGVIAGAIFLAFRIPAYASFSMLADIVFYLAIILLGVYDHKLIFKVLKPQK